MVGRNAGEVLHQLVEGGKPSARSVDFSDLSSRRSHSDAMRKHYEGLSDYELAGAGVGAVAGGVGMHLVNKLDKKRQKDWEDREMNKQAFTDQAISLAVIRTMQSVFVRLK
jgi:hypothetical protein